LLLADQRSESTAHSSQAAPDRHHLMWANRASEEHEINFPHGRAVHPDGRAAGCRRAHRRDLARQGAVMAAGDLPAADTRGRPLRDLRISVTDRCQFRCTYCIPREIFGRDFAFLPRQDLLTFEELTRLGRVFAGLGVRKLRLTGGEPLLRRDLERLVAMLAGIDGVEDIAVRTDGALLAGKARLLADAGLRRVTVSLDSLDDAVFMA